jgi:hypothetical protein
MNLLTGGQISTNRPKDTIKLQVRPGAGGGVWQFQDGSGRPDIRFPGPGEIFEVDKDLGYKLLQEQWTKYTLVPD